MESGQSKSNRTIYAENRAKYYDKVISMFESGMIAKDIVKIVPIGKSTVYRWYDEYAAMNKEAGVRKSPKDAADTIRMLKSRIEQLELLNNVGEEYIVLDKKSARLLQNELCTLSTNLSDLAERLSVLSQQLADKI